MSARLVQRINAFLQEADMPASVFGRAVARDPRLVADLQKGREVGQSLASRAAGRSAAHCWPGHRDMARAPRTRSSPDKLR